MPVRSAAVDLAALDALSVESYAVFLAADERPPRGFAGLLDWRLAGALSRLVQDGLVTGADGDALLASTRGLAEGHRLAGARLFVFGIGPAASAPERFANIVERAVAKLRQAGVRSVAVGVPGTAGGEAMRRTLEATFAALEGADVVVASVDESLVASQAARQAPVP